jgi:sugar lactone lactonase YvrE
MKKLLLAAAFMLAVFSAQAQTVTQAQMQGKWRMASATNPFGTVDIIKGTWKLNEKGLENKEANEEMFNGIVLQAQDAVLVISGNTVTNHVAQQELGGEYSLEVVDGKTYMSVDDGSSGKPQVFFKGGDMYFTDAAEGVEIIYKQIK